MSDNIKLVDERFNDTRKKTVHYSPVVEGLEALCHKVKQCPGVPGTC